MEAVEFNPISQPDPLPKLACNLLVDVIAKALTKSLVKISEKALVDPRQYTHASVVTSARFSKLSPTVT